MALKAAALPALQRLDKAAARLLPVVTVVLAALLSVQPMHVPGYATLTPAFILMATYHWTIYRPDLLPPSALFLVGGAYDLLVGAPPGSTSLLLLLSRAAVLRHRRYFINRPFAFVWTGFTLLTGGAMLFLWVLQCLLDGALLDLRGTIFRAVLTISLFPVASYLMGRTQRALMGAG